MATQAPAPASRRALCHDQITTALGILGFPPDAYDSRHVETYLRRRHSNPEALTPDRFAIEVQIATADIDFDGPIVAERRARRAEAVTPTTRILTLTDEQIAMLTEAIDSHVYWQLSDEHYRRDGAVDEPGSDDADTAETIAQYRALADDLAGTDADTCPECERSNGPNYRGPCAHGAGR
jgi:hypothetical protein